jgi:pSer/pThr/pTyr-binding forkhead associated (FHA) protein
VTLRPSRLEPVSWDTLPLRFTKDRFVQQFPWFFLVTDAPVQLPAGAGDATSDDAALPPPPSETRVFALPVPRESILVGRGHEAEVAIGDARISRRHAEFVTREDYLALRDLESRHGTFVDHRRILPNELAAVLPGSVIAFAYYEFRVLTADRCWEWVRAQAAGR